MSLPAAAPLGLHVVPAWRFGFTGTHRGPAEQCPAETCRGSVSGGSSQGLAGREFTVAGFPQFQTHSLIQQVLNECLLYFMYQARS